MQKIKRKRTADCVVGGFRYATGKPVIGSLLLGLYDDDGLLHHVGFTSSFTTEERAELARQGRAAQEAARVHRPRARRTVPLVDRALASSGSRSRPSSSSRSSTTTSPRAASATARSSSAGGPTRRRGSARWTRSCRRRCRARRPSGSGRPSRNEAGPDLSARARHESSIQDWRATSRNDVRLRQRHHVRRAEPRVEPEGDRVEGETGRDARERADRRAAAGAERTDERVTRVDLVRDFLEPDVEPEEPAVRVAPRVSVTPR